VALTLFIVMLIKNRQNRDTSMRHRAFYWVLAASIFSVLVDIISSTAMNECTSWWLYQLWMILYVLTMPLNAVFWMGYSAVLVRPEEDFPKIRREVHLVMIPYYIYMAAALTNPFTGLFFHLSPDMVYSRGILFLPVGIGSIYLYTLIGICVLLHGRRRFDNPANAYLLSAVLAATVGAVQMQLMHPGWLIICASYAILYVFCDMTVEEEHREKLYRTIEQQNITLKEAAEKANAASQAKSSFLASMSHDIRTPLNAIIGMTSMAIQNIDDRKAVLEDLDIVQTSSRHLLSLVNDVLDLSKIESGKMTISQENFVFPDLLADLESMGIAMFHARRQTFKVRADTVDNEFLIGDMAHLKQVLMNLLSNASKYTPYGGRIELTVDEFLHQDGKHTTLRFIVKDNGIGIEKSRLQEIFEPFTREVSTTVNQVEGTGLGLTIVKRIIAAMNGTIEVESEKGKGSSFTVSVPLGVQDREQAIRQFADVQNDKIMLVLESREKCASRLKAFQAAGIACDAIPVSEVDRCVHDPNRDYSAILVVNEDNPLEIIRRIRKASLSENILFSCDINLIDMVDAAVSAGADSILFQPVFKSTLFEELQRIRRRKSSDENERQYLLGRRILVAEDQPINYRIIEFMLNSAGAAVDQAENGRTALEQFEHSAPGTYDAILMDIMMPVMNGYDAARAIRSLDRPDAREIPIIAVSANAFSEDIQKSHAVGMNDHISKPIDPEAVRKSLTALLKSRRPEQSGSATAAK
jgi:signal transduction histidine kinase/CheY-like chemotaxis protein